MSELKKIIRYCRNGQQARIYNKSEFTAFLRPVHMMFIGTALLTLNNILKDLTRVLPGQPNWVKVK